MRSSAASTPRHRRRAGGSRRRYRLLDSEWLIVSADGPCAELAKPIGSVDVERILGEADALGTARKESLLRFRRTLVVRAVDHRHPDRGRSVMPAGQQPPKPAPPSRRAARQLGYAGRDRVSSRPQRRGGRASVGGFPYRRRTQPHPASPLAARAKSALVATGLVWSRPLIAREARSRGMKMLLGGSVRVRA